MGDDYDHCYLPDPLRRDPFEDPAPLFEIVPPDTLLSLGTAFGLVDRPLERITQPKIAEAYRDLLTIQRQPRPGADKEHRAGLLHTLRMTENQATWLVLRSRHTDKSIFTMTNEERRDAFLDDLYGTPAKWEFYGARQECLRALAGDGLISLHEYVR